MKNVVVLFFVLLLSVSVMLGAEIVKAYTTFEEPLAKELFDKFEADTGIKVEWVRLSTGEATARLEAEKENPQASIWAGGVGLGHIEAKQKGLTTPYKSPMLANTPMEYIDPDYYWAGLYIGPIAFATNINRAKELGLEAPQGWFDIIDSKYEKLVRIANPNTSGTAYNMITTILDIFHGDEELTFMFLHHLDDSIEQYTKSGSAGGKSCAIGEIPFAIGYAHDLVRLKAQGAPIEITVPVEGTGFEIASMSLVKNGPEPVNAKKLYNFLLGKEAQEIFASWYVVPVSKNAPQDSIAIDVNKLNTVEQDLVWDAANKERLVGRWTQEIGNQ